MDEEVVMYRVCPERNVPAAFQCFLGPDSRGMQRFFGDYRTQWSDDAYLIVRARSRRAYAGAVQKMQSAAATMARSVDEFNPAIIWCWLAALYVFGLLAWNVQRGIRHALSAYAPRTRDAAAVLGRWAAHYRLPSLFGSRTVGGLPV